MIFKTIPTDPADQLFISKQIGVKAYGELARITRRIYEDAEDEAKSDSIVHLPFSQRTGTFYHRPAPSELLNFDDTPPLFDADQPFLFDVGRVLAEYDKKREWRREARAYYLYKFEKMTLDQIAKDKKVEAGLSGGRTVSNLIRTMRGELSRLAGRDYELYTAERLTAAGYDVKLGGRVSEPDIIAKKENVHKVYSCKCLDYQRKTLIGANEFRPEIQYSLSTGARLVLAIHNLHDATDKYLEFDASDFPKQITLIP
jgi:hypothetical protein